jgi:signal transduction histidine kinase
MQAVLAHCVFPGDSEMARTMRDHDWNSHPLGAPPAWPPSLRSALGICLTSPLPMLICWGPELTLLYNDAYSKYLDPEHHPSGFAHSGRSSWSEEIWSQIGPVIDRVLQTGVASSTEPIPVSRACGDEVLVTFSFAPLFSTADAGGVDGVACTCIESRRRIDAPAPATARPRVLLVVAERALCERLTAILDPDFQVEAAGSALAAVELIQRAPPALVIAEDGPELLHALRADSIPDPIPVILITTRQAEAAPGADDYVLVPFTDRELAARVRTQLALATARLQIGEARAAARAKDDFLSLLGHELRNPLAALSMTVQGMAMQSPSPQLALMERATVQLTQMVDDLLDMSRLARGMIRLRRERVELAVVVDRAIARVQVLLDERETHVFTRVPRAGLAIDCDPERCAQVLSNVLANACKFSTPGGRVSVEAVRAGELVRMTVSDAGSGIAPGQLDKLFDPFAPATEAGGVGIGLAIARSLIELHQGTISVRSAGLGHGTQCVVEMPCEPSAPPPIARPTTRPRKRVLLVEDNDDTAVALSGALTQLGYQVALAHDGPVALTIARSFQPDVVLLDIGLPVMDGWELSRRLRELRIPARELHFIAITARDRDEDRQRSEAAGFADHLVKPIDLAKLERLVESLPDAVAIGP